MFMRSGTLSRRFAGPLGCASLLTIALGVVPVAFGQSGQAKSSDDLLNGPKNSFALVDSRSAAAGSGSDGFASSADVATSSAEASGPGAAAQDVAPVPAEPAPSGRRQADASYGYGSGGHHYYNHLAFEAGGGVNAPIGNDAPFITWGGNFTVGGGLRLQKHFSVLAEYQFMDNKLPGRLIADAGAQGGNAHIWSLTLDPVIDFFPSRRNDAYITGGGGFYRKVTSFTDPVEVEQCYYFCVIGTENVTVSHFSSNQGGLNFGFGLTHRLSSDSNLKLFAEARYVWINTPPIGEQDGLGTTGLIPVTVGVRF